MGSGLNLERLRTELCLFHNRIQDTVGSKLPDTGKNDPLIRTCDLFVTFCCVICDVIRDGHFAMNIVQSAALSFTVKAVISSGFLVEIRS